jgi:SAM-dependent methyltransferase
MIPFQRLAPFYPTLYGEKDYVAEASYVVQNLQDLGWKGGQLLEGGCGAGGHALPIAQMGYSVFGIDASDAMIAEARSVREGCNPEIRHHLQFQVGDLRNGSWGGPFSAAIALFHVMSYLSTPEDFNAALRNIRRHLLPGGLFAFDFWSGAGVQADPPAIRTKTVPWKGGLLRRTSFPRTDPASQSIEIRMKLEVLPSPEENPEESFEEFHRMRYLFPEDLRKSSQECGFTCERLCEWGHNGNEPPVSWNGFCVLRAGI